MVRLHGVERIPDRNHAVPRAIRFEVVGLRPGDGMRLLPGSEIGDRRDAAVRMHAVNPVRGVRDPMRTTAAGSNRVERVADKGDVRDAADQTALRGGRLTRRELVGNCGSHVVAADL